MKKIHLLIIGAILSTLVGIARTYGGGLLISSHQNTTELGAGIALFIIGAFLTSTGICFLINLSQKERKIPIFVNLLTAGMIAFWLDGIINGFLLFGAPQLSGQILNAALVIWVLICLWAKGKE